MSIGADLAALAKAYGVAIEFWDQTGGHHDVSSVTVKAVLGAFGVDAATAVSCRRSLAEYSQRHWEATVPPVIVFRHSSDAAPEPWESWVHIPHAASARVWIELEDGARRYDVVRTTRQVKPGHVDGNRIDEVIYRIPRDLPLGWHRFVAQTGGREASCALVVTPEKLEAKYHERAGRGWGVAMQLYSVRSRRSWGLGDLEDLHDMALWFGRDLGADFVLVNPLHAASPTPPMEASPYLPVTRRYANPIYIRVEAINEFGYLSAAQREQIDVLVAPLHAADLTADLLDRDTAWAAKRQALEYVFTVERTPGRNAEYQAFRRAEGAGLTSFALWCALAEVHGPLWNKWPTELRDPGSPQVAAAATRLASRVEFHCWLQWILDNQMADAQRAAIDAGMSIGIMNDLAVGVHRFGAETWSLPEGMARGVTVGAPPDTFNQVGQDWSQPPRRPDQDAATGYASYREMLRTLLRNSGGLRIDHVLGLFRLWWIPEGMPPASGTYVRYDHHAMVDILVLEAHRAGALVVGEDLGTVEPWVQDFLAERGILGTTILWFERENDLPKPPETWRRNAMASVTVHDLPPTAGYLAGHHVRLRDELGLLTQPVEHEAKQHLREVAQWRELLEQQGLVRANAGTSELVVALHRLLSRSPALLLNVALPDLVGDCRTQNQPGTENEYPNWRLPLCGPDGRPITLEQLVDQPRVKEIVEALGGSAAGRD